MPRKRFGQHFLADRSVVRRIVEAMDPQPGDRVAEIGPGLGALTGPLLERLPGLHVVEIDRDMVARLRAWEPPGRLVVHEGDALRFDFAALGPELRLAGNLPYNISTPLLFHVAEAGESLRDAHFMLQKEVVDRMVADPGTPEYGRLGVMLQLRFAMEKLFEVPPGAFVPPPRVRSAVVRLRPLGPGRLRPRDEALLARLVTQAFSRRRKTLRNALEGLLDEAGIARAGLDPAARPETVPPAGWVRAADAAGEPPARA